MVDWADIIANVIISSFMFAWGWYSGKSHR